MKKVYQIGKKYFNIEYIKNITDITIVNDYEAQEVKKKIDEDIDKNSLKIPSLHFYNNYYDKDCRTAVINIDGREYSCNNYKSESRDDTTFIAFNFIVTKEEQAKYDKFIEQAQNLIDAFKLL